MSRPQFAEIQFSTFPQQDVQLVDNPSPVSSGRVRPCRTSVPHRSPTASCRSSGLVFGLYIWLGGLAVGVSGGTAFIFGAVGGFLIFLYVRVYGADVPRRQARRADRAR